MGLVKDYPCSKKTASLVIVVSAVLVLSCGRTQTHITHRQTRWNCEMLTCFCHLNTDVHAAINLSATSTDERLHHHYMNTNITQSSWQQWVNSGQARVARKGHREATSPNCLLATPTNLFHNLCWPPFPFPSEGACLPHAPTMRPALELAQCAIMLTSFATNVLSECHNWGYKPKRFLLVSLAALLCTTTLEMVVLPVTATVT